MIIEDSATAQQRFVDTKTIAREVGHWPSGCAGQALSSTVLPPNSCIRRGTVRSQAGAFLVPPSPLPTTTQGPKRSQIRASAVALRVRNPRASKAKKAPFGKAYTTFSQVRSTKARTVSGPKLQP